jgi:hypothetical protein
MATQSWDLTNFDCGSFTVIDCERPTRRGSVALDAIRSVAINVGLVIAVFIGMVSIVTETSAIIDGDDLSAQERANVMAAQNVMRSLIAPTELPWGGLYVSPDVQVVTPSASFTGIDGIRQFADALRLPEVGRTVGTDFIAAKGGEVVLGWSLAGPVPAGILGNDAVSEDASIEGTLYMTLTDAQVEEMRFVVAS